MLTLALALLLRATSPLYLPVSPLYLPASPPHLLSTSTAALLHLPHISPYLPASPPYLPSTSTAALHPHDFVARFDGAMLLQLLQMPRQVRGRC